MADGTNPQGEKRGGRVLTGPDQNIFKTETGGRSDYGGLILSALTGMSQAELAKSLEQKGLPASQAAKLQKEIAEGGEISATLLDSEDQFFQDYLRVSAGPSLLAPPIAPERLERLVAENNALEPCIATMVTNISCTGWSIVPREGSEADLSDADKERRKPIEEFLDEVFPRTSFLRVRKQLRRDLHATGNSYMVLERNAMDELAFIRRAPAKSMRMIKLDDAVPVTVTLRRGGAERELTTLRAERRYVQKIGTKLVYYKEYGASRDLNRTTGEWAPQGTRLPPDQRAHEVIHDKDIEDVRSPYGMPRWITQLPSVLGSRMAEEHNLAFFQSGGLPPAIIFISGGLVSEQVAQTLQNYLSGTAKDKQRAVAVEVPTSGDIENEQNASVNVEKFGSTDQDSTFENYDERSEQRIRRAFRLPGIFLGMADSYNFATAHASYVVAEAQVFAPEREEEDERLNMTIMREIDPNNEWEIVSNPMVVNDANLQLRGLQMLMSVPGVGVPDIVKQISHVSGVDVEVAEGYEEEVMVRPPGLSGAGPATAGSDEAPQDQQGAEQDPAERPEANAQNIANLRMRARNIATRIAYAVRDYDEKSDLESCKVLVEMRDIFEQEPVPVQELINRALAPVLYNSPFLSEAAMSEVASGYAHAAFAAAERQMKREAH